jgi:hypothetical protein
MRPILRRPAFGGQPSPRRRALSFALTVAAHLLIAWLLLRLSPTFAPVSPPSSPLDTFDVGTAAPEAPSRPAEAQRPQRRSASPPPPAASQPPPPPPTVPQPAPTRPVDLSMFGDKSLADTDLSRLPSAQGRGEAEGDDRGADSVAPYGPGEGPGGQRLYNAEWVREPSHAELNGYLTNNAPPGAWALIACRTVADFQVDNCRVLGESPVGSRLGSAMRQAAWQFRIRPPRVGGKAMVGGWVRIRIDFGRAREE